MKLSKVHCAIALVALNCPVFGATIVVNSLPDADNGADGVCSLREAITAANNNANYHECVGSGAYGADIITFSISGTSFADEFLINDTLTIDGAGQSFVVDGGLAHRLFTVNPGKTLTLQNQTIANGAFDCGGSDCGAGILNNGGTLNLINVTINNCNAFTGSGGGIYNAAGGTLNVTGSTLSGNLAKFNGGGIDNAGTAIVTRSMFNNNSAAQGASSFGGGGAIMNTGTLTVTDCTFFNNIAPPGGIGSGGAIMNYGTGTFTSNTFNANSAQGGGAIVNYVGTSTFTSDTFNANSAQRGGAIATPSGTVNIINSTFTANSCHGGGRNRWRDLEPRDHAGYQQYNRGQWCF